MAKAMRKPPPLSRRYGYFHCDDCDHSWESAQVFCVRGTKKVYFRQGCRWCQDSIFPYRTERLRCGKCGMWNCHCTAHDRKPRERHVDPAKPHLAELCDKCKAGYPCQQDDDSDDYDDDDDDDCTCSDEDSATDSDETDDWYSDDEYDVRYERDDDEEAYGDYGYHGYHGYYASGRRRDADDGYEDDVDEDDSDYYDYY